MSEPEARGPEDMSATEWRAPSNDYSLSTIQVQVPMAQSRPSSV